MIAVASRLVVRHTSNNNINNKPHRVQIATYSSTNYNNNNNKRKKNTARKFQHFIACV